MFSAAILFVALVLPLAGQTGSEHRVAPRPAQADPVLTVLFFTASWCEPCREVGPILARFASKNGKRVKLVTIDFDRAKGEAARWDVREIPVVIVLSAQGKALLRYEGAARQSLATLEPALEDLLKRPAGRK
jgi:thioredoxin 2